MKRQKVYFHIQRENRKELCVKVLVLLFINKHMTAAVSLHEGETVDRCSNDIDGEQHSDRKKTRHGNSLSSSLRVERRQPAAKEKKAASTKIKNLYKKTPKMQYTLHAKQAAQCHGLTHHLNGADMILNSFQIAILAGQACGLPVVQAIAILQ